MLLINLILLILCGTILWILIGSRGQWWLKLPIINGLCFSFIFLFMGLRTLLGWPYDGKLPSEFEIKAITVSEPSTKDKKGKINVWLVPRKVEEPWYSLYDKGVKQPRSQVLPYSKQLAKQARQAQKMLRAGKRVFAKRGDLSGQKGKSKRKTRGKGKGRLKGKGKKDGSKGISWKGHKQGKFFELIPGFKSPPKE